MKVAFLFNAQDHHIPHSLPIACTLSALYPGHSVTVLARTAGQLSLCRSLAALYPDHRLRFELLRVPKLVGAVRSLVRSPKALILWANRRLLNGFDALVVPERTSLYLKRMGVTRPRYVHGFHGGGGHDKVDDPRLARFDLLLVPNADRLARIAAAGNARPGHAVVVGYSKFDLIARLAASRPPLFANDRPVILYNPHHRKGTTSWSEMGPTILDHFAARDDYNLIFAPHIRLFDPPQRHAKAFQRWEGLKHIHIDLGSPASIDMSYVAASDIYLGDISSQVLETLSPPRPCIFLNPRKLAWQDDPSFVYWRLGPVVEDLEGLDRALATRGEWAPEYEPRQRAAFDKAFPSLPIAAPVAAAHAIDTLLREGRVGDALPDAPSASGTRI